MRAFFVVPEHCHAQVAVHAHAGQEEDASKQVDREQKVGEFTRHFAKGPMAMLGQRAHPHWQGGAHTQVCPRQVGDVRVRLMARGGVSLCTDVHPEDQRICGQTDDEDESVKDTNGVEQGAAVERRRTHHRLHTRYIAQGVRDVGVPEQLEQVLQLAGAQTHFQLEQLPTW